MTEIQLEQYRFQIQKEKKQNRTLAINIAFALTNILLAAVNIYLIVRDDSAVRLKESIEVQSKQLEQLKAIENKLNGTISVSIDSTKVKH